MAIVISLAAIILTLLNPVDRLQDTKATKGIANSNDLEKALKTYILEHQGVLPSSMSVLSEGYHDICNSGYSSGCVDLSTDLVPGYLALMPKDPAGSTTEYTGYKLKFNPNTKQIDIFTDAEYEVIAAGLIPENWFDTGFAYRNSLTISNSSGSTQTNYQVLVSLNTQSLVTATKMKSDCSDIRFSDDVGVELSYWVESGCNTSSTRVWVKISSIPTSGATVYIYYGNPSAIASSSINNTFISSSMAHFYGTCNNATYCGYLDSHAEADYVRSNMAVTSTSLVTSINDNTGTDFFFRRYRFLFKPAETGTYYFSVDSDDASELNLFPGDGYGGGYNTAHPFGAHTALSYWYGGHGSGTCGVSSTIGSLSATANQGYWVDYLMNEWDGGQFASLCIRRPSSGTYFNVNTTDFPGQLFARKYTSGAEPSATLGSEEDI